MKEQVEIVEVTLGRAFKVWWSLVWRFCLFAVLVCMALEGLLLGLYSLFADKVSEVTTVDFTELQSVITFIFFILISIAVVQQVLKKKYSDIKIVLAQIDKKVENS